MVQTYLSIQSSHAALCPQRSLNPIGKGNHDKILLASNLGFEPTYEVRGDPEFIHQQLATSLERLQTDHIDLYYVHRTDPKVPIETTIGVLAEYVK